MLARKLGLSVAADVGADWSFRGWYDCRIIGYQLINPSLLGQVSLGSLIAPLFDGNAQL